MAMILLLDFLFRKRSSINGSGGDFSGSDCDGGDHAAAVAVAVKP